MYILIFNVPKFIKYGQNMKKILNLIAKFTPFFGFVLVSNLQLLTWDPQEAQNSRQYLWAIFCKTKLGFYPLLIHHVGSIFSQLLLQVEVVELPPVEYHLE